MKRLSVFVFTMLLGASLAFAQATGGAAGAPAEKGAAADSGKKATKAHKGGKKGHKGGKKGKKASGDAGATTPPK